MADPVIQNKVLTNIFTLRASPYCPSVTFVYCVETAKDTAVVAMECE